MSLPITKTVTFENENIGILTQNVAILVQNVAVLGKCTSFGNGLPISPRVVTLRYDISELRWSYTTNLGSKLSRNIILFICNQTEASRRPTEREIPNVTVLVRK